MNRLYKIFRNLSSLSFTKHKMVRYFPNNIEDFKSGSAFVLNKDEIVSQLNEHIQTITKRLRPSPKNVDGGLYVGVTGVAYMFYQLSNNPLLSQNKSFYIEKAFEYLQPALTSSAGDKTSFLLGDAGTYVIAAALYKESGKEISEPLNMFKSLHSAYLNPKFLRCGGDELFVGRAGYLAGALWLNRELNTEAIANEDMYKICDVMVASGRDYAKQHHSKCPLMYHYYNTEYLGAAHGVSFIMQMLISVPGYMAFNESAAKDIRSTIDYLASLQTEEGNWPCCMEEIGVSEHKLIHWCHGAPGMVYLMAKTYLLTKDQTYLDSCVRAAELVWTKGLLRKGPGICHGIAGSGYVFLLLYRLTGDEKYMYRAKMFADFINSEEFLRDARVPDNPESLYEGTAGTVCFLSDLLVPDKAEFPFQDVFTVYK